MGDVIMQVLQECLSFPEILFIIAGALAGVILGSAAAQGPVHVELMFVVVCVAALAISATLDRMKIA